MQTLFDQFIKEKRYLKNCSEHTLAYLYYCFKALAKHLDGELSEASLRQWVINVRQAGKGTGAINAYIRGINSFLSWLYENGHTSTHLKIKQLKQEQPVLKTFTDAQIKAIVSFKPRTFYQLRLHTLLLTLADTGIRINEALDLKRDKVDFDNLLLTVTGKGNKQRIVPFSIDLRKSLYKLLSKHRFEYVFPAKHGGKLLYNNLRREFINFMDRLGIKGFDGSFHAFRRYFAKSYVRNGGNLFYLQKALGHTTLTMSRKYVELETEDLQEMHKRTSILSRLK